MLNLTETLKWHGITQVELAARLGCEPSQVNHWCTGAREPSCTNLARIADAIPCSVDELLGRHKPMNKAEVLVRRLRTAVQAMEPMYALVAKLQEELGQEWQRMRKERGLSTLKAATLAGVKPRDLQRYEQGVIGCWDHATAVLITDALQ